MPDREILCIGELLWDSLPAGLFLGGAPFNVASHLHAQGVPASLVSRVGDDQLGQEALERLQRQGMHAELIQLDRTLPTGFVRVGLDAQGVAEYDIVRPAAWDAIELTDVLLERAVRAEMIVFGTLAQRSLITRYTIERLWQTDSVRVLDVNLRPPHTDRETVCRSLAHADIVKLNEHELAQLAGWLGWPAETAARAAALAETFGCSRVCVTRGEDGAALWHDGEWTEHPGFEVPVRDTVGSGDAFLATLLAGIRRGDAAWQLLQRANAVGAWAATQNGAVPAYDEDALQAILAERRSPDRRPVAHQVG
jgi:fructokinase